MLEPRVYQKNIKMCGNMVVAYDSSVENIGRRIHNGDNLNIDRAKAYKGVQSTKSINRIKQNLQAWLYSIEAGNKKMGWCNTWKQIKPVMLTLTLCAKQIHTDKEIKAKALEPFLKYIKLHHNVINYFWRAEPQQNGNIHFHLIIDKYINKEIIQKVWNRQLNRLGYVDIFYKLTGKTNPPSTQVQLFSADEKGINYCLKYVTKENEGRIIEGLQYRVSNKLSHIKIVSIGIEAYEETLIYNILLEKSVKMFQNDRFTVFYFESDAKQLFRKCSILAEVDVYYSLMFQALYVYNMEGFQIALLNKFFNNRFAFNSLLLDFAKLHVDCNPVTELLHYNNLIH